MRIAPVFATLLSIATLIKYSFAEDRAASYMDLNRKIAKADAGKFDRLHARRPGCHNRLTVCRRRDLYLAGVVARLMGLTLQSHHDDAPKP